jgi:hypothetical protein
MNSTHSQSYNSENIDHEIFWNEFRKIVGVLQSDLDEIEQRLKNDDSQVWRRTYYRTFFAYLEGQAHALKQLFLFYDWWTVDLDTEYKIRNQRRIQNKDGSIKIVDSYIPLVQNIKLLFKAFAVASDIEPIILYDDKSWELLAKAASVRNRIVHPKKSEDLVITDEEIRLIKYVGGWFLSNSALLLKKRVQSDIKTIKAMDESARKQFGLSKESFEFDSLIEEFEDDE